MIFLSALSYETLGSPFHLYDRQPARVGGPFGGRTDCGEYETPIYRFLVAMTADRDAARDCAQDTFVRALEHLRKGRDVNVQWLYKVARNRAMAEFRRVREVQPDIGLMTGMPVAGWSVPEERVAISQAFASLSPDDRAALFLYSVEGMGADELAAALGIRESALRMRLSRARARFRRAYGGRR